MITEVLGFLIIVGTIIVVVFRRQFVKNHQDTQTEQENVEIVRSTEKLRYELERSADEIIQRMGSQMDRLEKLIAEADKRVALLDLRMAELERSEQSYTEHLNRTDAANFSQLLQHSMTTDRIAGMESMPAGMQEIEPVSSNGQDDIRKKEPETPVKSMPFENGKERSAEAAENFSNTQKVKELLLAGYSTEAIAKETNMGRGAIELVRQMQKGKR